MSAGSLKLGDDSAEAVSLYNQKPYTLAQFQDTPWVRTDNKLIIDGFQFPEESIPA